MILSAFVQWVCLLAALITVFKSLDVISSMNPSTNHLIRAAYVLICVGSFGEVVAIMNGHQPGMWETMVVLGLGVLCIADRRCALSIDQKGDVHHV